MKEIWAIYNRENDLFDRIVFRGFWFYRQQLFMNADTNTLTWRDVPFFVPKKKP